MELDAHAFAVKYFPLFLRLELNQLQFIDADAEFGKAVSFEIGEHVSADLQIQEDQLSLTVIERDDNEPNILLHGVISFEDRTLSINSEPYAYEESAVVDLIQRFNDLTCQN